MRYSIFYLAVAALAGATVWAGCSGDDPVVVHDGGHTMSDGAGLEDGGDVAGDCPTALEPVACPSIIETDLVLDGQVMSCTGDLRIQARLTLRNGSRLESTARYYVQNNGALVTDGTEDCKIRISSPKPTPGAGDWRYITVDSSADNASMLTHTVLEYGGDGLMFLRGGTIGLDNVTVQHTAGAGLALEGGVVSRFRAVSFNDIPGAPIRLHPNHVAIVEPDIAIDAETVQEPFVDVDNATLTINGSWEDIGVPYRLFGDARYQAELTIGEGAQIWLAPAFRAYVQAGGSVKAMGTAANPVEIRSANPTGTPGDWRFIRISADAASDSLFRHTSIAHGGAGGSGAVFVYGTATFENVTFVDNAECDISAASSATVNATDTEYIACD